MTKLHPTEPMAEFTFSVPQHQNDRFFEAVAWQLPQRPGTPPTLATVFRQGEFAALQKMNIALHKVLHGEQKYRFNKELVSGHTYAGETFLSSRYEKSGSAGSMSFYVFQTNLKDQAGAVCVECLTTIIVRG